MKKLLPILLSFMLVLLTIGPLPSVFAAAPLSSIAKADVVSTDGLGQITVTLNNPTPGESIRMYSGTNSNFSQSQTITSNSTYSFTNLTPGNYSFSVVSSDNTEGTRSISYPVTPKTVTLSEPSNGKIFVSGAAPGAEIQIRHTRPGFNAPKLTADENGRAEFNIGYIDAQIPPGKGYWATQTYNGVESTPSNYVDIAPSPVDLVVTIRDAGPDNNAGVIQVNNTRPGNRLYLYTGAGTELRNILAKGNNQDLFEGLGAGQYYVIQEESSVKSTPSETVTINDKQAPTITLIGSDTVRISLPATYTPHTSDVEVQDNLGTSNVKVKIKISPNPVESEEGEGVRLESPGVYKVTYTATDVAGNSASTTKTVTVAPQTLTIKNVVHTGKTPPGKPTGSIIVNPVMANATLNLYQDPNNKLIRSTTDTNTGDFEITDIPVGKGYYVVQVVNGVASDPSPRIEIIDETPPVIQLNGNEEVEFVRGDNYIEYGATATDNIDNTAELSAKIVINRSDVNMDVPGIYTVTYNVIDNAGNRAAQVIRIVHVRPHAVIAIGSNADLGEVGVKNAFPGSTLKLYSTAGRTLIAVSPKLAEGVTTYVFTTPTDENGKTINSEDKIAPGSYFVVQEFEVNGEILVSIDSNIVDVRDTNRPYITIIGAENINLTFDKPEDHSLDESKYTYIYDETNTIGHFTDPGAIADDYLDKAENLIIKKKITFGKTVCNENIENNPTCENPFVIDFPGIYTITYSVTTKRGAKADDKQRTITVAPPKVGKLSAEPGESKIVVENIFIKQPTDPTIPRVVKVNLYNKYRQLVHTDTPDSDGTITFSDIPAGLGYFVTQTVNGIESAPSLPINVTLFGDADNAALITAFGFDYPRAVGVINQETGTIEVVVPKNTIFSDLKATFTANGIVKVGPIEQKSGVTTGNNFLQEIQYTVTVFPEDGTDNPVTKTYTVKVIEQSFKTESWTTTVHKSVLFSPNGSTHTLTSEEITEGKQKGISFVGQDRAIHIPASNVIETTTPTLSVQTNVALPSPITADKPMTIRFGTSSAPFVQPIEVEVENKTKSTKQFARFVRENGQWMAYTQLSQQQGDNLVGLATEPGTYALVDEVQAPRISSSIKNGQTAYKITSPTPGATVYYTTSSQTVSFERSARNSSGIPNPSLEGYQMSGASNLANWSIYSPNEEIVAPSGELYAVAVRNGVVSLMSEQNEVLPKSWSTITKRPTSHVFTINFNARVDRKVLYSGLIYVTDDATGEKVETRLELGKDQKSVLVIPTVAYKRGKQYTLHIEREFKGNTKNNEFLKQPLTQTFIAE